jgi:hypothetical protein
MACPRSMHRPAVKETISADRVVLKAKAREALQIRRLSDPAFEEYVANVLARSDVEEMHECLLCIIASKNYGRGRVRAMKRLRAVVEHRLLFVPASRGASSCDASASRPAQCSSFHEVCVRVPGSVGELDLAMAPTASSDYVTALDRSRPREQI